MYKLIYFIYYIIMRPFKKIGKFFMNISKYPREFLRFSIILCIITLFSNSTYALIKWLWQGINPTSVDFITILAITLIIYIWKEADPSMGEHWKQDYNALLKRKQDKIDNKKQLNQD